jgi:hypothetical protein
MATISGYRGDSFTFDLEITDGGSPVDLTNSCLIFSVKERASDSFYALQRTNAAGDGIEIIDAINGEISLCINATGSSNSSCLLKTGPHLWDIQMITPGSQPKTYTVLNGTFCIQEDITR